MLADGITLWTFESLLTVKHINYVDISMKSIYQCNRFTVYFTAEQTIAEEMSWRFTDNSLPWMPVGVAHKETASIFSVNVYDTLYDFTEDVNKTVTTS